LLVCHEVSRELYVFFGFCSPCSTCKLVAGDIKDAAPLNSQGKSNAMPLKHQGKSSGSVLPYVGVACLGATLFGYHLGYVS